MQKLSNLLVDNQREVLKLWYNPKHDHNLLLGLFSPDQEQEIERIINLHSSIEQEYIEEDNVSRSDYKVIRTTVNRLCNSELRVLYSLYITKNKEHDQGVDLHLETSKELATYDHKDVVSSSWCDGIFGFMETSGQVTGHKKAAVIAEGIRIIPQGIKVIYCTSENS